MPVFQSLHERLAPVGLRGRKNEGLEFLRQQDGRKEDQNK